jgi:hypothetical protein
MTRAQRLWLEASVALVAAAARAMRVAAAKARRASAPDAVPR